MDSLILIHSIDINLQRRKLKQVENSSDNFKSSDRVSQPSKLHQFFQFALKDFGFIFQLFADYLLAASMAISLL